MRIRQNSTMLVKAKAWLGRDMKVKSAVCSCAAITCAVALAVGGVTYAASVHSTAVKEAAETIEADNADYAKLINKYNKLVDKYNGLIDEYNDAVDTVDEAKKLKSDIKDLQSQRDSLKTEVEQVKRTTVDDGVWQVGTDIDAGTYRAAKEVGSDCYWEIDNGDDIAQNDIPGGGFPQFTVSDGQQLKVQNCGTFTKQ